MALPWYVAGQPRPQHAQYAGWQQADAIRASTAALRARSAPAPSRPAAAPRPLPQTTQTWQPTPQRWQQHLEPSQRQAGNWGSSRSFSDVLGGAASAVGRGISSWWERGMKKPDKPPTPLNMQPRYQAGVAGRKTELPFNVGEGLVVTRNEDFTWKMPDSGKTTEKDEEKSAKEQKEDKVTAAAKYRNASGYDRQETIQQLTMEEWNALSPRQQAAVQFNADLIAAVEADKALVGYTPSDSEKASYNQVLMNRFGTTESSAPSGIEYAPNVAGLLKNVGYASTLDAGTLDDFLKLDVAIGMDEIRRIDEAITGGRVTSTRGGQAVREGLSAEQERLQRAQHLAGAQTRLAETLGKGDAILSGMTGQANTEAAVAFGAEGVKPPAQLSSEDAMLKDLYLETMTAKDLPLDEVISRMNTDMSEQGLSTERQKQIQDTLLFNVRDAVTAGGWQFQTGDGLEQRDPMEVAQALGAPILGVGG